jgi:hypothetical protein
MKILIIIPWFGPWPGWYPYFLQSCRWNREVDWMLVTDNHISSDVPSNVHPIVLSLDEFSEFLSIKLKLQIKLGNPYKICDLRPAFGDIFARELKDYAYWGYSDIDVIYGNIMSLIDPFLLKAPDVIGVREEYLAGHFALFRNTRVMREMYKDYMDYKKIFTDTRHHYAFDERTNYFGKRIWIRKINPIFTALWMGGEKIIHKIRFQFSIRDNNALRDMDQITRRRVEVGEILMLRKTIVRSDQWYEKQGINDWNLRWENGTLRDPGTNEQFLHFHLIRSKHRRSFRVDPWKENHSFMISRKGINIQE